MAKEALTGFIIGAAGARWARGELNRGKWTSTGSGSIDLPPPAAEEEDGEPRIDALREAVKRTSGEMVLGLPSSAVLLRTLDLPSIDDEEIAEMLSLQLDQFLPLPQEEMVVSHEVLARRGDTSLILVAAAPTLDVEAALTEVNAAGARIIAVDAAPLGWLATLGHAGHLSEEGRQLFVIFDTEPFLLILDAGLPLLVRRLLSLEPDAVERDTAAALMSVELAHGASPVVRADIVHGEGDIPSRLTDAVCEACGMGVNELVARELAGPAVGVAMRAMRDDRIDLYPPHWRSDAAQKARRRKVFGIIGSAVLLWAAAMAAIFSAPVWAQKKVAERELEFGRVMREADQIRVIKRRVEMIMRYKDRSQSIPECILKINDARRSIGNAGPKGLLLEVFEYEYGKEVTINGRADRPQFVYDFKNKIDQIDIFETSELVSSGTDRDGKEKFTIKIQLPEAARGAEAEE